MGTNPIDGRVSVCIHALPIVRLVFSASRDSASWRFCHSVVRDVCMGVASKFFFLFF